MLAASGEWPNPGCDGASRWPWAASRSSTGASGSRPSSPWSQRIGRPCPRSNNSSCTPCTVNQSLIGLLSASRPDLRRQAEESEVGSRATGSGPPRRPEHPAGQRAGVLAMMEDGLAAHDHMLDALGSLHAARRAARPVARDLVLLDVDPGEIEDHEVGHHALPHETSVT